MIYTLQEAADRLRTNPRKLRGWLRAYPDCYFLDGRFLRFEEKDIQPIDARIGDDDRVGFIYLIGFATYLKIGFSTAPKKRIAILQTAVPEPLTTHCIFPGTVADENRYHNMFATLRMNGEWFRSDPSIIQELTGSARILNSFFEGRA